jgi:hypothetical protein
LEVNQDNQGFHLRWDPPAARCKYLVEMCELQDGNIGQWRECAKVDDCSITIADFPETTPASSYRFRVRAENKQGISEPVESSEWMRLQKGGIFKIEVFIDRVKLY